MSKPSFRVVILGLLFGLLMASTGCGAAADESDSFPFGDEDSIPTTPETLIAAPSLVLDPEAQQSVEVHSGWICELQRRTFNDPADIDQALALHLERIPFDRDRYDRFILELASDQGLRDAVLFNYQETCRRN